MKQVNESRPLRHNQRSYERPRIENLGRWQHLTRGRSFSPGHRDDPKPIGPGNGRGD